MQKIGLCSIDTFILLKLLLFFEIIIKSKVLSNGYSWDCEQKDDNAYCLEVVLEMKKKIIKIVIIIIVLFLIIWRWWTNSFSNAFSVNKDDIASCYAYAKVNYFDEMYSWDFPKVQEESLDEILKILGKSRYRQDYRNLLPWGIEGVSGDKNYDGHIVYIQFVDENDEYIAIQFLSGSIVAVSAKKEVGFKIYHPTNHDVIYDLVEYLKIHGVKKEI